MHTTYEYSEIPPLFKQKLKDSNLKNKDKIFKNGKTRHYCGIVHIDGESLLILPKIDFLQTSDFKDKSSASLLSLSQRFARSQTENKEKNLKYLIYMLLYSQSMSNFEVDSAFESLQSEDILEFFIQIFAKNLFNEVERGFYKEYILCEENLRVLKGKILPIINSRKNFTKERIYCEYDEFTPDNRLNQFFYFASEVFAKIAKTDQNRKFLKDLLLIFDEVTLQRFSKKEWQEKYRFSRINERFSKSYDLAIFILEHLIFDFEDAKNLNYSFVFDMNKLFEKFIAKAFQESCNAKLQKEVDFGELKIYPDILLETQKIVIDTKYKIVNGFPRGEREKYEVGYGDIYQMFAYCKALGYKNGILLYPKHLNQKEESITILEDISIEIRFFELTSGVESFQEYINSTLLKAKGILEQVDS